MTIEQPRSLDQTTSPSLPLLRRLPNELLDMILEEAVMDSYEDKEKRIWHQIQATPCSATGPDSHEALIQAYPSACDITNLLLISNDAQIEVHRIMHKLQTRLTWTQIRLTWLSILMILWRYATDLVNRDEQHNGDSIEPRSKAGMERRDVKAEVERQNLPRWPHYWFPQYKLLVRKIVPLVLATQEAGTGGGTG